METTETGYKSEIPPTPTPLLPPKGDNLGLDVVLIRVLLFAATLTALIVMVTSKQTELVTVAGVPIAVSVDAKFNYSPAFIYFVAAMAVACLWSIISTLSSLSVISKPAFAIKFLLFSIILDVLILGVVAAATGAAGGVSYVGYKGNKHTGWSKVCNVYDKYCRHIAASLGLSLFASVLLVLLILLSALSLRNRIPPPAY